MNVKDMARIVKGSHSLTCHPHIHQQMKYAVPAFAFPAKAGPHLIPIQEGWKAELA